MRREHDHREHDDPCRSEHARDELKGAAFILRARVIVDVHRERARSYRVAIGSAKGGDVA